MVPKSVFSLSFFAQFAHHNCMKLIHSFALVLAISALSGFRSDDTYSLKHKILKGEEVVYQANLNISAEGSEVEMDMKMKNKVLSLEEDGAYELEETLLSGTFKLNGDEHPMDKGEPKATKYDKDGKKIKKEGSEEDEVDPVSKVMDDVFEIEPKAAVKIGEIWKLEGEYGTMTLTLEGKEKVGEVECLKINLKGTIDKKDATGDVTGTFLIRADDFSPEVMEAKIENAKIDPETPPMKKIEFKLTRVKE